MTKPARRKPSKPRQFAAMSRWAIIGSMTGLILGVVFDSFGHVGNPVAEGVVRFISGSMDSVSEIGFLIWMQLVRQPTGGVGPYVIGTVIGSIGAPIIHWLVHTWSPDPYGLWGALYAFAYSNADNVFGSIVFFLWILGRRRTFGLAWREFIREPFQQGNILAVAAVFSLDILVRSIGFSPVRNTFAALESTVLDLDTVLAAAYTLLVVRSRKKGIR